MSKRPKPSKQFCLESAKYYHDNDCPLMMWDWLVMWAFYDMYVEAYR